MPAPQINRIGLWAFARGLMMFMLGSKRVGWSVFNFLLPFFGGVLMGVTTSPVEAWPLAWVALVPLWVCVRRQAEKGGKFFVLLPLFWGFGYHGVALFWITGIHPMTWMGVPWLASLAIAFFCWVFITFWGAALVTFWAFCQGFIVKKNPQVSGWLWVLTGTALWCFLEAVWSSGPLWWSSLSYTQSPHNLLILQLGKIGGPTAITAAIVAVNGLIAEGLMRGDKKAKMRRYLVVAGSILVWLHLAGLGIYLQPVATLPETALKVGIIQGNIPNTIKLFENGKNRAMDNYTKGYQELAERGVDAVLTPEGALPFYFSDLKSSPIFQALLDKKVVLWLGAFGEQGLSYTNSLFTVMGNGEVFSRYNKVKLVPLGEYIPFENVLGGLIDRLSPLDAHMAAGSSKQVFDTPFGRAIMGICYESAFAEHFRRQAALGGEFILTASNNAHYAETMPAQHHAQDVMRAIETDRWAVRSTNTGYSGIVDPHGNTIWLSGINSFEVHSDVIYRRSSQTLYVRWGDWLVPVLLGLAGIGWIFNRR